jgi:hypothetical protein
MSGCKCLTQRLLRIAGASATSVARSSPAGPAAAAAAPGVGMVGMAVVGEAEAVAAHQPHPKARQARSSCPQPCWAASKSTASISAASEVSTMRCDAPRAALPGCEVLDVMLRVRLPCCRAVQGGRLDVPRLRQRQLGPARQVQHVQHTQGAPCIDPALLDEMLTSKWQLQPSPRITSHCRTPQHS